jgi:hypothetical protein
MKKRRPRRRFSDRLPAHKNRSPSPRDDGSTAPDLTENCSCQGAEDENLNQSYVIEEGHKGIPIICWKEG